MEFIGAILALVISLVVEGWMFSQLWQWFIVPTFDAPALPIPAALGICLALDWLAFKPNTQNRSERSKLLVTQIVGKVLLFILAFLVAKWMPR